MNNPIHVLERILHLAKELKLKDWRMLEGQIHHHGAIVRAKCPDGNVRNILVTTTDLGFMPGSVDGLEQERLVAEMVTLFFNSLDSLGQLIQPIWLHIANENDVIKKMEPGKIFHIPQNNSIPMVLFCPNCGRQHIDHPEPEKEWTNPPHKSHLCAGCGTIWRPADVCTVGVAAIETRGEKDTFPSDRKGRRVAGTCIKCQMYGPSHLGECEVDSGMRP